MTDALLETRAGSTGEDWISVTKVQTVVGERVCIATDGGLVRTEMLLDHGDARALRDALTKYLAD